MEKIIVIAHGSPKGQDNNIENIRANLASSLGINKEDLIIAYLKFGSPSAEEAIKKCINDGATKIIIHPFFLSSGSHVITDIPNIIAEFNKLYPNIEFLCTKPLGQHKGLAELIKDLIKETKSQFYPR